MAESELQGFATDGEAIGEQGCFFVPAVGGGQAEDRAEQCCGPGVADVGVGGVGSDVEADVELAEDQLGFGGEGEGLVEGGEVLVEGGQEDAASQRGVAGSEEVEARYVNHLCCYCIGE